MTEENEVPPPPDHVDAEGECDKHPNAQLGKQRVAGSNLVFCPRCAVQNGGSDE